MTGVNELIKGYKRFYTQNFIKDTELYKELASKGQSPKTLVIACSDSRADPSIVMDAQPGDIFVIRNVANLVPPYEPGTSSYHGTSAALEFAVNHIKVEHIIVLGHGGCAGINALLNSEISDDKGDSFINSWMQIAKKAKETTLAKACSDDDKQDACEKEAICESLNNLMTFPWIKERVEKNTLQLHGWHFAIDDGSLTSWDKKSNSFKKID